MQGKEKALLIKRDSSGHTLISWIQGIVPTEARKSLQKICSFGGNANSSKHIICFTRNLNYFKFQHLTVSRSENRYLILNLAYLWQLSYLLTYQRLNCGAAEAKKWRLIQPELIIPRLGCKWVLSRYAIKHVRCSGANTRHGVMTSSAGEQNCEHSSNLNGKIQCTHTCGVP